MKKIICLFQRNWDGDHLVRDEIVPGAEWVVAGEGVATRKWDGSCCLMRGGKMYRRYDAKKGKKPPPDFEPAQEYDPVTGHMPGWIPVGDGPADKWHREALENWEDDVPTDSTYELCGPKIGGNPEGCERHVLIIHGQDVIPNCPRDFAGLKSWFADKDIEGIVWHHPDGRMVKITKASFGLSRR